MNMKLGSMQSMIITCAQKLFIPAIVCIGWSSSALAQTAVSNEKMEAFRSEAKQKGWTFEVDAKTYTSAIPVYSKGLKVPENWRQTAKFRGQNYATEKLPARWDWRERGGVTPVKNQGSCGSCWAFGTVAAFESAIMIATGKLTSLSEQQLVSCSPSYGSCSGGYYAFGLYEEKGANYSEDFPYKAANVSCKQGLSEHEDLMDWSYVGSSSSEPSVEDIKSAIFNFGVVAVTVAASGAFDSYKKGIYNECNRSSTNHMVALVGWDDETQTWIMKNSWGKNWGEDGYMHIKYNDESGRKCNRIGETAAYGVYKPKKAES